jgi:hypothetical protein
MRAWIILFGVCGIVAYGIGSYVPIPHHYDAWEKAEECTAYRTVVRETQQRLVSARTGLVTLQSVAKERRELVETCAGEHFKEKHEVLIAEICPDAYRDWLLAGRKIHVLEEDVSNLLSEYRRLKSYMMETCPQFPQGTLPSSVIRMRGSR